MADSRPERTKLRLARTERPDLRPERPGLRLERPHSKKKRRYLIVVFQKIVFLRTFLYFVSKHQIQRIVQQIQRIVQQIPENCEKYKKCTRSPGKKRKIQKMY